ncbi:hypothetical protein AQ611_10275 [Burkholderia singularis]|nr:hypothetical protein AQ611_10275 [Burkholderia sp. Bp7605]
MPSRSPRASARPFARISTSARGQCRPRAFGSPARISARIRAAQHGATRRWAGGGMRRAVACRRAVR